MPSEFPAYVSQDVERSLVHGFAVSTVAGETLLPGDLCIWDGPNAWVERAGANPAAGTIVGISEVDSASARLLTPDNRIPIRVIDPQTIVIMSSTTDYVEATHRQVEYGVTRSGNGRWQVDTSKTGANARVVVVGGYPVNWGPGQSNLWLVKFLAEFLAQDGIDS